MERKLSHLGFPINSNKARLFYAKDSAERCLGTKKLRRRCPYPRLRRLPGAGLRPNGRLSDRGTSMFLRTAERAFRGRKVKK